MAAENNPISGDLAMVFFSPSSGTTTWNSVAHATSHTISQKLALRSTSNKGSGDIDTNKPGRLNVTATLEGMYIDNDKYNLEDFMIAQKARTPILVIFGKETVPLNGVPDTTTSGGAHFYASGQFYITGVDSTFPDHANSTYTVTLEHASGWQINKLIVS